MLICKYVTSVSRLQRVCMKCGVSLTSLMTRGTQSTFSLLAEFDNSSRGRSVKSGLTAGSPCEGETDDGTFVT